MTTVEATATINDRLSNTAAPDGDAAGAEGQIEFISFSIGEDQYGVEITAVREIKGWTSITHLPRQPDYVRGVLNLRGVMVPIIDLRCRFGQGTTDATPMHVVIIVQIGDKSVGILADRVLDIVSFERSQNSAGAACFARHAIRSSLGTGDDRKRDDRPDRSPAPNRLG